MFTLSADRIRQLSFQGLALALSICSIFGLLLSSIAVADGGVILPRIVNGSKVSSTNSPIVQVRQRTSSGTALCTGTLLTSRAVLTAWHCVTRRASEMSVVIAGRRFTVTKIRTHPRVRVAASGLIKNDVAILTLSKPTSKPTMPLLTSRSPQASDVVTVIGYGLDDNGRTGVLRQGLSTIDRVSTEFVETLFTSLSQANSCSGDSGGPAILRYTDPFGVVRIGIVGTVSTGTTSDCWIGDRTYYVNTQSSEVLSFIAAQARGVRYQ